MIDPQDIRVTSYLPQSGYGAGGMTVGMTTSGVIVHHIPSGIGISCDSERSQYANKEKAIQMLEALVLAIESEKHFPLCPEVYMDGVGQHAYPAIEPRNTRTMGHKVNMIKEVKEKAGCGLKEAKEAVDEVIGYSVDFDDVILKATLHLLGKVHYKPKREGYCIAGDNCLCSEDFPEAREDCFEWKPAQ